MKTLATTPLPSLKDDGLVAKDRPVDSTFLCETQYSVSYSDPDLSVLQPSGLSVIPPISEPQVVPSLRT